VDSQELLEVQRVKREIEETGFNINTWYREMTEKDQDSCSKKLICELRAKQRSGRLSEEEEIIADKFGSGGSVDVSEITVEFDLASQIGKFMGDKRCKELYSRCTISTSDMVEMIKTEFDNLKQLEKDLESNEISLDREIEAESRLLKQEVEKLKTVSKDEDLWVWSS